MKSEKNHLVKSGHTRYTDIEGELEYLILSGGLPLFFTTGEYFLISFPELRKFIIDHY